MDRYTGGYNLPTVFRSLNDLLPYVYYSMKIKGAHLKSEIDEQ